MKPHDELVWRRLLAFTNADRAIARIVELHGDDKSQAANRKKQAAQLRAAILQAREYFDAAGASSLYTSPNHLYYGVASLATAIMLVHGNGTHSLDYLRQDSKNKHHGALFKMSTIARDSATHGFNLLDASTVEVIDRGHVSKWYSTLPNEDVIGMLQEHTPGKGGSSGLGSIGTMTPPSFGSALAGRSFVLANLMATLPDIILDRSLALRRFASARTLIARTNVVGGTTDVNFSLNIATSPPGADVQALLDEFKLPAGSQAQRIVLNVDDGHVIRFVFPPGPAEFEFPDARFTNDDRMHVVMLARAVGVPEFADAYLVSFSLSMLARYYPDLWVSSIESWCGSARAVELFVATYLSKFPLIALRYISGKDDLFDTLMPVV